MYDNAKFDQYDKIQSDQTNFFFAVFTKLFQKLFQLWNKTFNQNVNWNIKYSLVNRLGYTPIIITSASTIRMLLICTGTITIGKIVDYLQS